MVISLVEFVSDGSRLLRRLVVCAAVVIAGVLLMLARSSPALAADSHSKVDSKSSSATSQRHDSPSNQHEQEIGGDGDIGRGSGGHCASIAAMERISRRIAAVAESAVADLQESLRLEPDYAWARETLEKAKGKRK